MSIRRVVTGFDSEGMATVLSDGPATAMTLPPEVGATLNDIWQSSTLPLDTVSTIDPTTGEFELMPAGSLFRVIDFEPGEHAPMWHTTASVDFIYVARGEITLMAENGELTLYEGDTIVQRGIHHAWQNRGSEPARLVNCSIAATLPPGMHPT